MYGHLLVIAVDGVLKTQTDSVVPYTSTTAYGAYTVRVEYQYLHKLQHMSCMDQQWGALKRNGMIKNKRDVHYTLTALVNG